MTDNLSFSRETTGTCPEAAVISELRRAIDLLRPSELKLVLGYIETLKNQRCEG